MIKIQSTLLSQRGLQLAVAGLGLAAMGYLWLDRDSGGAPGKADAPSIAASAFPTNLGAQDTNPAASPDSFNTTLSAQDSSEDDSTALETGMEDWQKPENITLRAELQRWHDHREETTIEQRRADASALMAQVEARQASGKLSPTSAALAKLMLLKGAPSDDPQHAARLQEVMTHLAGQLSFGE